MQRLVLPPGVAARVAPTDRSEHRECGVPLAIVSNRLVLHPRPDDGHIGVMGTPHQLLDGRDHRWLVQVER